MNSPTHITDRDGPDTIYRAQFCMTDYNSLIEQGGDPRRFKWLDKPKNMPCDVTDCQATADIKERHIPRLHPTDTG